MNFMYKCSHCLDVSMYTDTNIFCYMCICMCIDR